MNDKLSGPVGAHFERLLTAAGGADVGALRGEIRAYLEHYRAAARVNGLLPVDIAEALAAGLEGLLDGFQGFSSDQQRMIVAAARYFVSRDDVRPDAGGVLGLDDDVEVFNYVVEQLGQPHRKLEL